MLAAEGRFAGEHGKHHHPQGVQVSPVVDRFARCLFGSHVFNRADKVALGGVRVSTEEFGNTEVREFHGSVGGDEQVARLEVAMNHAMVVRALERTGHGDRGVDGGPPVKAGSLPQHLI